MAEPGALTILMPLSLVAKRPALNRLTSVRFREGLPNRRDSRVAMQRFAKPYHGSSILPHASNDPMARMDRHRSSKPADAGSNPAWVAVQ